MSEPPVLTKAYRFANGMVMAFDQNGRQMPEYQGRYAEVVDKIREAKPGIMIPLAEMARD